MEFIPIDYEFNDAYSTFLAYKGYFTATQCQQIIQIGLNSQVDLSRTGDNQVNAAIRNSKNSWVSLSDRPKLLQKLHDVVIDANRFYQFDIDRFDPQVQFTVYEKGQYYHWHQDSGPGQSMKRKLSVVVNLSHELSYSGGKLQFFGRRGEDIPQDQGDVIVFPSFEFHRVTPVKEGTRYSLITWVGGKPFR